MVVCSSQHLVFSTYLIVNPLSAMMDMLGLSFNVVRNPLARVSSMSEMDRMYTSEMKQIAPFGVHATKNFTVLWCLYWLHVDDCICKCDGVSMNTSLPSMIA